MVLVQTLGKESRLNLLQQTSYTEVTLGYIALSKSMPHFLTFSLTECMTPAYARWAVDILFVQG